MATTAFNTTIDAAKHAAAVPAGPGGAAVTGTARIGMLGNENALARRCVR